MKQQQKCGREKTTYMHCVSSSSEESRPKKRVVLLVAPVKSFIMLRASCVQCACINCISVGDFLSLRRCPCGERGIYFTGKRNWCWSENRCKETGRRNTEKYKKKNKNRKYMKIRMLRALCKRRVYNRRWVRARAMRCDERDGKEKSVGFFGFT